MTVAASGMVIAVLARFTGHAARTDDGVYALMMDRVHHLITTAAGVVTGPVVMTVLAVIGAAIAGAGPLLSRRLVLGAWPAPAEQPGRRAIIAACAFGAAGVFAAGFLYTAVISTMTAPSDAAAAGALVCLAIAAVCALAPRPGPADDEHRPSRDQPPGGR